MMILQVYEVRALQVLFVNTETSFVWFCCKQNVTVNLLSW